MCNKITFATRGEAKEWARNVQRNGGSRLRPYLCDHPGGCRNWHLTAKYTAVVDRALERRRAA